MTTPLYLVAFVRNAQNGVVSKHISAHRRTWAVDDDVKWDFPEAIIIPDNNYLELYLCLELDDILFSDVGRPGSLKLKAASNNSVSISNCEARYDGTWYNRVVLVNFYTKAHANDYSLHLTETDRGSVDRLGSVIDSVEALNSALVNVDTPNGTEISAYTGHGFGFKTKYSGMLSSISVKCREDGTPAPNTGAPSWVKVWGVDHGNYTLLALSKNYQVHHVGDTLHYVFDPFYVTAGQELRVIFYSENEIDSTTYVVGNSSCCMKVIKLVATEATPIFGGVINNTGGYAYSGATVWQADYKIRIVTDNGPANANDCRYALFWSSDLGGTPTRLSDLLTEGERNALSTMSMHLSGSYSLPLGEYALLVCKGADDWNGNDLSLASGGCLGKFSHVRYFNFPFGQ
jgi:hypothetical protein